MVYYPRLTVSLKQIPMSHGHGGFLKFIECVYEEQEMSEPCTILVRVAGKRQHFLCLSGVSEDNLPIPKEVNRKKNETSQALFLTPVNGYGHHFNKINYLSSF